MSEQTTQRKAEAPPRVVLPREISLDAIKAMSSDELRRISENGERRRSTRAFLCAVNFQQ